MTHCLKKTLSQNGSSLYKRITIIVRCNVVQIRRDHYDMMILRQRARILCNKTATLPPCELIDVTDASENRSNQQVERYDCSLHFFNVIKYLFVVLK